MNHDTLVKRQVGHRARLVLSPDQVSTLDGQAHAARALWSALHDWWTMVGENRRVDLKDADAAIKQARKDIDFLAALPAQAAQAVLKTYFRAWRNCWAGRADPPAFKSRIRSVMSVDVPQGRDWQSYQGRDIEMYMRVVTGSMLSVIPLIIAIIVLQRYWRGGMTAGAVKG